MILSFTKLLIKSKKSLIFNQKIPVYTFILGRMFKKDKTQENKKQKQQQAKYQAQMLEKQKKIMQKQVEDQNQYDFLERQKQIELNKDFRKQKQIYKNSIPEGIGKSGFDQLVFWSQNAHTPQQIVDLIQKFNKTTRPKKIQDIPSFYHFMQNVKQTVYLAQNYKILVEYSHFGYKYEINQPQYWLKIQQKVVRKPPRTQEQLNQLIDILFVMGNMGVGQVIFSKSQKILQTKVFTVQQIAKLIIAYFKTGKGQREWIIKLLTNLQMQIQNVNCQVLQSILPILKRSKNIPMNFQKKLENQIIKLENQINLSQICIISNYFGFQKGEKQLWQILQKKATQKIKSIIKQKGKIPSSLMRQIIDGILSSYKFSTDFVNELIISQLQTRQCKVLYRLNPITLSTLSKCLYIYQLQQKTKNIQDIIQGLIMKHFEKADDIKNQDLIHVLKDYTVTRVGTRQFYLFLQGIVNQKLADIKTERYTVQALTAIYQQSNLCSTDTLELLRGMAYE